MAEPDTVFEARIAGAPDFTVFVRANGGLIVLTRADGREARTIHVDDVREVAHDGARVTITPARGDVVGMVCDRAAALDAALVAACSTLPELTRALHSLGSSRASSDAAGQREFFAPLLDARRRAEESVARADVVAAFDADRLTRALDGYLEALIEHSADKRPAARRALAARAEDATEPLRRAIEQLRRAGTNAANPPADARVASWRHWKSALQELFAAADRCWGLLHERGAASAVRSGE
ncbi:MAG: hypothetical protein WBQ26_03585 [Gemmatimonadaceae bacterium]|nr:hypothetical protein [Gemmatimonadaceae bacterium]